MLDSRIVEAIAQVFGMPKDQVTPDSSQETIPEWDSVGHLKLILAVEEAVQLRFAAGEIPLLVSAARIQEALDRQQHRGGQGSGVGSNGWKEQVLDDYPH